MTNTEKLSIFGLAAPNVYTDFRLADLMLWFCSHSFFLFFFILYEITVYVSRYHWLPLFPLGFTWVCTLLKFVLSVIVLGDLKQHTEISLSSQSKLYPATITTILILDFFSAYTEGVWSQPSFWWRSSTHFLEAPCLTGPSSYQGKSLVHCCLEFG